MSTTQLAPPPAPSIPSARRPVPWRLVAVAATLAVAPLPLLIRHAEQIWLRPHYQFFPLLLVGAAVLAFTGLRGVGPLRPGSPHLAILFLAGAWGLLAAAELLSSSWLGAVAALALLAAALFAAGGAKLFWKMLPAWALLWLAVPPPFELDRQLILALQAWTAGWASAVLDFLGLFHVMAGNVVEVGGRRLLVEEACSGVNSLFSVLACTLFFVFLMRRPPVHATLLVLAAVAWVLAANVARVVGVAYVSTRWGIDLTEGWRHETFGAALFGAALALVWSTDRLLLFLLARAASAAADGPSPADGAAPASARRSVLTAWPLGAAYLLLIVAHFVLNGVGAGEARAAGGPVPAAVDALGGDALPARFERWKQLGFNTDARNPGSAFGEFSKTWSYQAGPNTAALSVDYTFPSWHDLTRCYTGQGWTMDEQAVRRPEAADDDGFVAVRFTKPAYRSGYLLFCEFDPNGAPLEPRLGAAYLSLHRQEAVLRRWWDRLRGAPEASPGDPAGPVYQVQVFVESYTPLSPAERAEAEALFVEGLKTLRQGWRPGGEGRESGGLAPQARRP